MSSPTLNCHLWRLGFAARVCFSFFVHPEICSIRLQLACVMEPIVPKMPRQSDVRYTAQVNRPYTYFLLLCHWLMCLLPW
ncbi:hypothetical protein Plhal703r1_c04g0023981 [Plasmopara halstedii]